jgi:hypothetical protein
MIELFGPFCGAAFELCSQGGSQCAGSRLIFVTNSTCDVLPRRKQPHFKYFFTFLGLGGGKKRLWKNILSIDCASAYSRRLISSAHIVLALIGE